MRLDQNSHIPNIWTAMGNIYHYCNAHLNSPPFLWLSWLFKLIWLLIWGEKWAGGRVGEVLKSSSMSRTLANRLLEGGSISFILFWIWMVLRVNFSPGRDIRRSHGIHCKNITRTCVFCHLCFSCSQKEYNIKYVVSVFCAQVETLGMLTSDGHTI